MEQITIIKDRDLLRDGLITFLQEKLTNCHVTALNGNEYDHIFNEDHQPDILIVDLKGIKNLAYLISFFKDRDVKIGIWLEDVEEEQLIDLFKLGVEGYLFNGMEPIEFLFAIKYMLNGQQYIHPHLSSILLREYISASGIKPKRPKGILSEREWEVLEQIVEGHTNSDIAKRLFISCRTVNNHLATIYKKLHVSDRTNAALLAVKNNWISL
ncbi:response regulator transcription factor [Oceanobacillus halotolerans]|uniref:response regulator transcription factor n=1 Tax=Oceanobacillus halotolerans TaxID=2663380 RepID=UPI0013D9B7B2|nr:response regulator transcription factor [Oceanobacillus halotolerans]